MARSEVDDDDGVLRVDDDDDALLRASTSMNVKRNVCSPMRPRSRSVSRKPSRSDVMSASVSLETSAGACVSPTPFATMYSRANASNAG